jgi:hypothetical protein
MSEEQITELTDLIPITEFDPYAMNPQELVSLDPEMLLELLPQLLPLMQQFMNARGGGGPGGGGPGGGGPGNLQDLIRERLGPEADQLPLEEMLQGAGGGGGLPPERGGRSDALTIEDLQRMRDEASGGRQGGQPGERQGGRRGGR